MKRQIALAACVVLAGCVLIGCQKPPADTGWKNPLDEMEKTIVADPEDGNYVLTRMEFARQAVQLGCPMRAEPRLREAFDQLETLHENTAAALSSERFKYYKGESYERAMLCWYMGFIHYARGDYNTARILFSRALAEDRKAVVHDDTDEMIGEDFGLAYYWLARAYEKLGQADNARIAYKKANVFTPRGEDGEDELADDKKEAGKALKRRVKGEQWAYEKFHNPEREKCYIAHVVNLAGL